MRFATQDDVLVRPGRYRLVMRATAGPSAGQGATGIAEIRPVAPQRGRASKARILRIFDGSVDIPLGRLGIHTPVGSGTGRGALIGSFDGMEASFVIGTSAELSVPQGGGASLELAVADSEGLRGRWIERIAAPNAARGYFCLEPVPRPGPPRGRAPRSRH